MVMRSGSGLPGWTWFPAARSTSPLGAATRKVYAGRGVVEHGDGRGVPRPSAKTMFWELNVARDIHRSDGTIFDYFDAGDGSTPLYTADLATAELGTDDLVSFVDGRLAEPGTTGDFTDSTATVTGVTLDVESDDGTTWRPAPDIKDVRAGWPRSTTRPAGRCRCGSMRRTATATRWTRRPSGRISSTRSSCPEVGRPP